MTSPLPARIDALRRRLRRSGIVRGLAIVIAAVVAGAVVGGSIDAVTRSNSAVVRLLLTGAAFAPAVWAIRVVLLPPLRLRASNLELARRIEQRDATWSGRLSAAAAFQDGSRSAGSAELQRQVVADVDDRLAWHPLPELVDFRRVRRACFLAAGSVIAGLAIMLVAPAASGTALSRLVLPLASIEWPRAVDLVLLTEEGEPLPEAIQIGRGQTLRFVVRNEHGDVPDDLALQIVPPDGRSRTEPVPVVEETTASGAVRTVGSGMLLAEAGPLQFRVVGGDHRDMRFLKADVVPPPVFDRIEVTVTPPAYLAKDAVASPEGIGSVQGYVGSSVTVRALANKPLASAELRVGDRPGPAVSIEKDRRRLTATFMLEEPGFSSYWFRLVDRSGFENSQAPRYEIRTTADGVPQVSLEEPSDDVTATPFAELPVVVQAEDDQGLVAVRLRFNRGGFSPEGSAGESGDGHVLPLFNGPERPAKGTFPLVWSLEPLKLNPGQRLVFYAEATDAFDLGPPHVGTSGQRTVTIVSAVEKRNELLDRQSELLDELVQIRRDETRLRNAVESLRDRAGAVGEVPSATRDLLARTELEQRQLSSKLTDPQQGIGQRAARAHADLAANGIDDAEMSRRLERVVQELAVLGDDALPAADRNLTAARKAVGTGDAAPIDAAGANLAAVLDGLDALLCDLGAWRDRRDVESELGDLLGMQQELNNETAKSAAETLGAAAGQLTDAQAEALQRLSLRQHGLADRLVRFVQSVEAIVDAPRQDDPAGSEAPAASEDASDSARSDDSETPGDDAAATEGDEADAPVPAADPVLADVAERLRQAGLSALARSAGDSLRENDLGEAGRYQQQLVERLRDVRERLSPTDQSETAAAELGDAAQRLDRLAAEQREVLETLRKADEETGGLPDDRREALARRQAELRETAASVARDLRDADGRDASLAASAAGKQMSEGLERLMRRDDAAAQRSLEQALEHLEKSREAAEHAADQQGRQLAREQLESARETIAALAERQAGINREVARLETVRSEQGHHSRSQLLTLRKIASTQAEVAASADALTDDVQSAKAVAYALGGSVQRMRRVEQSLRDKDTGELTQQHGAIAKRFLDLIAESLGPVEVDEQPLQDEQQPEDEQQPSDDAWSMIEDLKIAREIQKVYRDVTVLLHDEPDDVKATAEHRKEIERLADDQAALEEHIALIFEMIRMLQQPAAEQPAAGGDSP